MASEAPAMQQVEEALVDLRVVVVEEDLRVVVEVQGWTLSKSLQKADRSTNFGKILLFALSCFGVPT